MSTPQVRTDRSVEPRFHLVGEAAALHGATERGCRSYRNQKVGSCQRRQRFLEGRPAALVETRRIEGLSHAGVLAEVLDEHHQFGSSQKVEDVGSRSGRRGHRTARAAAPRVHAGGSERPRRTQRRRISAASNSAASNSTGSVNPAHAVYGNLLYQQFLLGRTRRYRSFLSAAVGGNCGIGWCWAVEGFHGVSLGPRAGPAGASVC